MTGVTIMVTDETARQLRRLLKTGRLPHRAWGAFDLAYRSRPIPRTKKRWIKIGNDEWELVPERGTCGGTR